MTIADFLSDLFEHGRVRVGAFEQAILPADWQRADVLLADWDRANRLEFPCQAPQFEPAVARWAAEQFYRAAQCFVFRDLSTETVLSALSRECPPANSAEQHYTVDLVFRFLPDLYRQARLLSQVDPLCQQLCDWARHWPLSSVGIELDPPADATPLAGHAGLWRLYVDRTIARRDWTRLTDDRVRQQARTDLGVFTELAPELAARLANPNQST